VVAIVALVAAAVGLAITVQIVREEGWDGLWQKKRGFIEKSHPETGPALDKAERLRPDRHE
jgi:hypothetical protein